MENKRTSMIVTLPESLLLLATDDETGKIKSNQGALDFGIAGAVITELLMRDRLASENGKLVVTDSSPTDDAVLDKALAKIGNSKPRDAKHWVTKLARDHEIDEVLDRLVQRGMLRRQEHRFLWVIPDDRYPAENSSPEQDVRRAVRATVADDVTPTPRIAALIGLLTASKLEDAVFTKEERKQFGDRLNTIVSGDLIGGTVSKAVKDVQAMVVAATLAAVAAGGAASSS